MSGTINDVNYTMKICDSHLGVQILVTMAVLGHEMPDCPHQKPSKSPLDLTVSLVMHHLTMRYRGRTILVKGTSQNNPKSEHLISFGVMQVIPNGRWLGFTPNLLQWILNAESSCHDAKSVTYRLLSGDECGNFFVV